MCKRIQIRVILIVVISIFYTGGNLFAQNITITDDDKYTPDNKAMLDVKSETKGLLVPRVALVNTTSPISDPKPLGLMVWNTSTSGTYSTPGFYFWNGTNWEMISSSSTYDFGNGLTESGGNVIFGGTLTQTTTVSQGNYNMNFNLNGTGDFVIQDNGTAVFTVNDQGQIKMGDNLIIEGSSTCKVYRNLASYSANTGTGAFVLNTSQPMASNCMFRIRIEGYFYHNTGPFDITVGSYCTSTGFHNQGLINLGSLKVPVRLARNTSTNNVALIIGDTTETVDYPKLTVSIFMQTQAGMTESYAEGWAFSRTQSFSGYDYIEDVPDKTNASGFWSINGNSVYLTDTSDNVGIGVINPGGKLEIKGDASGGDEDPIFEVKNKYGQVMFGVYNEGVRVYVDEQGKGGKAGFAVAKVSTGKAGEEYLRVTPDSVRIYIDESNKKGGKAGFAVAKVSTGKGALDYLSVRSDSTRVYTDGDGGFGAKDIKSTEPAQYIKINTINSFIGHQSGIQNFLGKYNVFMGYQSGYSNTGNGQPNPEPVADPYDTSGTYNVFIGYKSGKNNILGCKNVFIGQEAGLNNVNGIQNTYVGEEAGVGNSGGHFNSFFGSYAGASNTGSYNTMIGMSAGHMNNTGSSNTCLGYYAGISNRGNGNTIIGTGAGRQGSLVNNSFNIFLGYMAGGNETNSYRLYIDPSNTSSPLIYGEFDNDLVKINGNLIVRDTLRFSGGAAFIYNGDDRKMIDSWWSNSLAGLNVGDYTALNSAYDWTAQYEPGSVITSANYPLVVTTGSYGTPYSTVRMYVNTIGEVRMPNVYYDVVGSTNIDLYIDNTGKLGYLSSSIRYKDNINDIDNADWIYQLRPVTFNYKDGGSKIHYGLIAEEVEKINPDFVFYGEDGLVETVQYSKLITPLIEVIQEQKKKIDELEQKISEIEELKRELEELKKTIK
ncbi:MAG: tail fiber domain-containing protein [Bacteroidales bacterium]|nr:tail fiber domain-containing protein [Bacteroidales bacterium]